MSGLESQAVSAFHAPTSLMALGLQALSSMAGKYLGRLSRTLAFRPLMTPSASGLAHPVRPPVPAFRPAAADLARGIFDFVGERVVGDGRVIFDMPAPSTAWLEELHGLSWLAALLEAGGHLHRMQARVLVDDWRRRRRRLPQEARRPLVAATRLTTLVTLAPALLQDAPEAYSRDYWRLVGSEFARLRTSVSAARWPHERLLALLALATAALACKGLESQREHVTALLIRELERQILPDGGHVSRSPAIMLEIAARLQPLLEAWKHMPVPVPPALDAALQRMLPMLRMLRHGDGGLALFNGVADPDRERLDAVLAADDTGAAPLMHAPHAGYLRLEGGRSILIMDAGHPPASRVNPHAGLSTLALEFSHGPHRIFTSCGQPLLADAEWHRACRHTAAHSAPALNDADAGRLFTHDGLLSRLLADETIGPATVAASATRTAEGALAEAEHDAWGVQKGWRCRRRLFLSADGQDLRGEDALLPVEGGTRSDGHGDDELIVRFHLHPNVTASPSRDRESVLLVLPDRSVWRFRVRDALLSVEESIFLATGDRPRHARQIVLRAPVGREGVRVAWKLERQPAMARPARRKGERQTEPSPALPL